MKIKLIDGSVYEVTRVDVIDGRVEIDFQGITAEEVQDIFTNQANISNIELLTDEDEKFGDLPGWTVYSGVMVLREIRTVILTKSLDTIEQRLTAAEVNVLTVSAMAESAKERSEDTASQVTDLQMAMCEIYERMEV